MCWHLLRRVTCTFSSPQRQLVFSRIWALISKMLYLERWEIASISYKHCCNQKVRIQKMQPLSEVAMRTPCKVPTCLEVFNLRTYRRKLWQNYSRFDEYFFSAGWEKIPRICIGHKKSTGWSHPWENQGRRSNFGHFSCPAIFKKPVDWVICCCFLA